MIQSLSKINHLAFDLWNTTAYSLERDPLIDLIEILEKSSLNFTEIQSFLQTRQFTYSNPFPEICDLLKIPYCHNKAIQFMALIEKEREQFQIFEDTLPVLIKAKKMGFTVSLVSNLWSFCIPEIKKLFFSQFDFDYTFFSFEIGHIKPSFNFFHQIELAGLILSETVVIGDSFSSDILGAINSGAMAIWLKRDKFSNICLPQEEYNFNFQCDRYLGIATNLYQAIDIVEKHRYIGYDDIQV